MKRDLKKVKFKVYSNIHSDDEIFITKKPKVTDLLELIEFIKEEFEKIEDHELLVLIDKMIDWKEDDPDLDFSSGHFCIDFNNIYELWGCSEPFLNFFDLDRDPEKKNSIYVHANLEIFEYGKHYLIIIKPHLEKFGGELIDDDIESPIIRFFYRNLIFKKINKNKSITKKLNEKNE